MFFYTFSIPHAAAANKKAPKSSGLFINSHHAFGRADFHRAHYHTHVRLHSAYHCYTAPGAAQNSSPQSLRPELSGEPHLIRSGFGWKVRCRCG
jgi:hypothetical protein